MNAIKLRLNFTESIVMKRKVILGRMGVFFFCYHLTSTSTQNTRSTKSVQSCLFLYEFSQINCNVCE